MPIHIVITIIFLILAYKYGDFKNWKKYYNTILFLGFGDLIYTFLFKNKMLWVWKSQYLDDTLVEILWILILFPSIILLYLPHFPKNDPFKDKFFYILTWIVSFSALEWIIRSLGGIVYENGWQFQSSVIFYCLMFPILLIHHTKPLAAIFMSAVWVTVTILIFQVPL